MVRVKIYFFQQVIIQVRLSRMVIAQADERAGCSPFDAMKLRSNTNDLRGKILRIHPEPDATYTIPEGNLFRKVKTKHVLKFM